MDQSKSGTCESHESSSQSTNTKTYPEEESISSSEKLDAASSDMIQISASSSEACSKEAAEAKEEIPQSDSETDASEEKSCLGTKVKSPVEASNVASENETDTAVKVPSPEVSIPIPHGSECVGAEAKPLADVPIPLTMEKIGKVMPDIFPFTRMYIPSKDKTCLGAIPKTSVSKCQAKLERYRINERNQKSPESYKNFLLSRSKSLKRLTEEIASLKNFMEGVKMETSGTECLDSDDETSKKWCRLLENWQDVLKYLDRAKQKIKSFLENVENVEIADMQNWIDIFSSLRIYLEELDDLCRGEFYRYRSDCSNPPSCEFILRVHLFPEIAKDVLYRVTYEMTIIRSYHTTGSDTDSSD